MAQIFPIDFDEKLTIAQDDYILFSDSEDGNKIKKAQYSNLKGEKGDTGTAATITVGSTTTGTPGSSASVVNSGTTSAAVLDFTIPEGEKGDTGDTGASIVSAAFDGDDMVFTKDDGDTVTLTDAKVDLKGDTGDAATITVGTTTTLSPGSSATVTNSGTTGAAVFNFGIPEGEKGDTGDKGDAATISVGTTTTGEPGTSASVTNSGTTSDAVFNFTIPKGAKGDPGATGTAATISVGSTTTGEPGTDASVTNSGTSSAAVFDFTIPQGEKGDTGTAATIAVGTVTTGAEGSSATVTNSGTSSAAVFDFSIPKGDTGATGSAATISVGTTSTLSPGSAATVTNSGTSSAAVFEFGIPQGQTGATGNGIQSITSSKSGKITTVTVTETNGDSSSFQISDGQDGEGSGDVLGPSSASDSHFALFDGTTGKLIKNGGTIVDVLNSSSTTDALSANQGKELNSSISTINGKIPSAATSSNQLADKNYVDNSINSVTAYYITKNAQGDQFATKAELLAATTFYSGGVVRVPTRNDYTIVLDDETHNDEVTRYIYNNGWEYQYTINESPLTQAQLDALNSGITSGKVSTYDGYATTISGKQDKLTTQTAYTTKGTSTKVATISTNTLGQVTAITETSIAFPVTSVNGSAGDVTGLQTTANLKTDLTDNSDSYYPSQKAVKTAVDAKLDKLSAGTLDKVYIVNTSGTQTSYTVSQGASNNAIVRRSGTGIIVPDTPGAATHAVNKNYVDGLKSVISVTLTSSGWSSNTQTVTATGVTASNTVIVSPAPASFEDYGEAKIYCSAQASNSLTFTCTDTPSSNITVNVLILN